MSFQLRVASGNFCSLFLRPTAHAPKPTRCSLDQHVMPVAGHTVIPEKRATSILRSSSMRAWLTWIVDRLSGTSQHDWAAKSLAHCSTLSCSTTPRLCFDTVCCAMGSCSFNAPPRSGCDSRSRPFAITRTALSAARSSQNQGSKDSRPKQAMVDQEIFSRRLEGTVKLASLEPDWPRVAVTHPDYVRSMLPHSRQERRELGALDDRVLLIGDVRPGRDSE